MSTERHELRDAVKERCAALEPGSEPVTPLSNRSFRVRELSADHLRIRFDDSGEERVLRREQFEVFADRSAEHRLAVSELPPSVEPYTRVLTLLADFGVADDEIAYPPVSRRAADVRISSRRRKHAPGRNASATMRF